jgi:hypothetical protein
MKTRFTHQPHVRATRTRLTAIGSPEMPEIITSEFPAPRTSTGTVDDDDEPEDEHDDENEASERELRDDTEAPEEFERDDEDRSKFD